MTCKVSTQKLETTRKLDIRFSYNKKLEIFHGVITNIQQVLVLWKSRSLTLEGKIALSKIAFQALIIVLQTMLLRNYKKFRRSSYGKQQILK